MKSKKRNNKKQTNLSKVIKALAVCCVIAAVILVVGVVTLSDGNSSVGIVSGADSTDSSDTTAAVSTTETTTVETTTVTTAATTAATTTTEVSTVKPIVNADPITTTAKVTTTQKAESEETQRIVVNPEQELWNLVVVNSGREMPEGYVPQLQGVAGTDIKMDYRVAPWYDKMYYAAKEDGITLTPYSGYRSYERQKYNYNNLTETYMSRYGISRAEAAEKAATVILPPGTSEHNLGLAMDICNTKDSFATQKEYDWLMEHAHEYGFILRYTEEKMPITGIVDEPWHWRYVGVEYAEKIKNSGLCLEEYLDSVGIAY